MNSEWSAFSQQRDYERPSEGSVAKSAQHLLHASYYMIGIPQVLLALAGFLIVLLVDPKIRIAGVLAVLASPFLVNMLSLYQGNTIVYVAELPPFDWFYNERYGLYWIGFVIFIPLYLIGILAKGKRIASVEKVVLSTVLVLPLFFMNVTFLAHVAFRDEYRVVREAASKFAPGPSQLEIADVLKREYDWGKILITRASHDVTVVNASIPLKNYINEGNYLYYDQALERPWLFARWVIMYNSSPDGENELLPPWARRTEKISQRWGNSVLFHTYYDLVLENRFARLYRIREPYVLEYSLRNQLDISSIPSLNRELDQWDPETVYVSMYGDSFYMKKEAANTNVSGHTEASFSSSGVPRTHTVQAGETLWSIAEKYYGSGLYWERISSGNSIRDPRGVAPGMIVIIP